MIGHGQTLLSLLALLIIGALAAVLVVHAVPPANTELVTFALGALAGALTVGGGAKPPPAPPSEASDSPSPQFPKETPP